MHVSNKVNPELLSHFFKMIADGAIMESDLTEFCDNPRLWRKQVPADDSAVVTVTPNTAQPFWQGVWDELLGAGRVAVPPVPKLTKKQVKSLDRFGFMLMYLPALDEDQYPEGFAKPNWSRYLEAAKIERKPLDGMWVAVETIRKPDFDDPTGYPDDRLMAAVKKQSRFNTSWDDLHEGGLLQKIAKAAGFPQKGTRLPTAEEWNLVGNLMNWLREHRSLPLPDLGSTRSWEWCENTCESRNRLYVGYSERGGLAYVGAGWLDHSYDNLGFRVLAVL